MVGEEYTGVLIRRLVTLIIDEIVEIIKLIGGTDN